MWRFAAGGARVGLHLEAGVEGRGKVCGVGLTPRPHSGASGALGVRPLELPGRVCAVEQPAEQLERRRRRQDAGVHVVKLARAFGLRPAAEPVAGYGLSRS